MLPDVEMLQKCERLQIVIDGDPKHTHPHSQTHWSNEIFFQGVASHVVPTSGADLTPENRNLLTFIEMYSYHPLPNSPVPPKTYKNISLVPVEAKYVFV